MRPPPSATAHAAGAPGAAFSRRLGLLASIAVIARPARSAELAAAAPPPPAADEPPIITQLRARSAVNKKANDEERLASYYRRNRDALRVLLDRGGARTLDPAIRAKIQKWLDENGG